MTKESSIVLLVLLVAGMVSSSWMKLEPVLRDRGERQLISGISGHPLSAIAYNANGATIKGVSLDAQLDMLNEMGLSIYRMDVYTDASGKSRNHALFLKVLARCRNNGIEVLPMIYDRCRYEGTPEQAYEEGFSQMAGFARLYGQYLTYFELGNEMELFDKLRVSGDGRSINNYDMDRVARAEQYIRGMEEGLKSVRPQARSMVNTAGFLPVFWMDRMFAAAPTIDICAWHVYPEMPPLYKSRFGIEDIHDFLFDRYQRPIWYTETNARAKKELTFVQNETAASKWRKAFVAGCRANPNVEAVIYHELLDNPERGGLEHPNFEEEHFGFVKFDNYPGKDNKAAFRTWKAWPERYQHWSYKKVALDLIYEHSDI